MSDSRGNAVSAYIPAFAKGAQVYGENIASGTITSAHIKDGTVIAADVAAGSITSAKIGTAAVTNAKMKAAFLSGTLVSGQTTRSIAHGLGVKPKSIVIVPILTLAQAISAYTIASLSATVQAAPTITLAAASAATSAVFYVIGSQKSNAAIKYAAYVQI